MLRAVRSALVLLGPPDRGPFTPAAVWPNPEFNVSHLTGAAERALRERRGLFIQGSPGSTRDERDPENPQIAYPIEVSGKIHGAVILEIDPRMQKDAQGLMRQVHWGAAWLEVLLWRTDTLKVAATNERLQMVLDLLVSAVEQDRFQPAAMAFATQLATKLECDRVSLGFEDGEKVQVQALSHSAEFGKQMNLVRAIEAAMDESLDQQAVVVYPSPPDAAPLVIRAHEELARQHGSGAICTVPLSSNGRYFGGLTFERPGEKPFDRETVEFFETLAALVGPILDAKRKDERWLIAKAGSSLVAQFKKFTGPGNLGLKTGSLILLAVVIFFYFARWDFRVTTQVNLEGTIQRAVCAPFNGYIWEARARHGDTVREGDVLCIMDERDLKLERLKWATQSEQFRKQYQEALAKHDRPQIVINRAKIDQAEAQIGLLDEQLRRTRVTAPFNGVIMKGDLSQSLGAPVERGQVLFEVAPLESYRVIVQVDERDIGFMAVGQGGILMLPSMPGKEFPFVINKITPVSVAKEGRNYFRVEAQLKDNSGRIRPGMEGVGKVHVERRRIIWIWTRELIDWLRLTLWRWMP